MIKVFYGISCTWALVLCGIECASGQQTAIAITDGPSIQRALDASPGQVIDIPPGDYELTKPLRITHDHSGLAGYGRLIQTNPKVPIIFVADADGVRLQNLTLTRTAGAEGEYSGLLVTRCEDLAIDNLRVLNNRAPASAMNIDKCVNSRVCNCLVLNYMGFSVEDRTGNDLYGYAYKSFDGTGIQFTGCRQMLIQNNRVIERRCLPTPEVRDKYGLGKFTAKNEQRGTLISQEIWDAEYVDSWRQGSAIYVGGPKDADQIQLIGNYIENAAQGIDVHADHVIASQNIVNNAVVGMKAMHGSRNTLILGNQFIQCDMHGVLLQPGASSHAAGRPRVPGDSPEANIDGASIIASNIFSDFGYGHTNWLIGNLRDVVCLEGGQLPENPPLRDVVVQGNVVYDPGRDKVVVGETVTEAPPRYRYALVIHGDGPQTKGPKSIKAMGNLFAPGQHGVCNVPDMPW